MTHLPRIDLLDKRCSRQDRRGGLHLYHRQQGTSQRDTRYRTRLQLSKSTTRQRKQYIGRHRRETPPRSLRRLNIFQRRKAHSPTRRHEGWRLSQRQTSICRHRISHSRRSSREGPLTSQHQTNTVRWHIRGIVKLLQKRYKYLERTRRNQKRCRASRYRRSCHSRTFQLNRSCNRSTSREES